MINSIEKIESIFSLQVRDVTWISLTLFIIISSLFEWLSKEYKPWTYIFKELGKALNRDISKKIDITSRAIDCLSERITKLEENDILIREDSLKRQATNWREDIIIFSDECTRGIKHSKENFDRINEKITAYENYCETHPGYKNNKSKISIIRVNEIYKECLKNNDFL